jgi:hypothetical protein
MEQSDGRCQNQSKAIQVVSAEVRTASHQIAPWIPENTTMDRFSISFARSPVAGVSIGYNSGECY